MIGTPIAFGLTMIVCFTLFYYYWRIRQLRARLLSVQSAPAHDDLPVEFGIGKNVVETFPTIKACELKCTATEDLQCPICLVEYEEWEVLRQLPFCGHIFHTLCVGAWFEKQTTCPVCRMSMSELTEPFGDSLAAGSDVHCRGSPSSDVTIEVVTDTPSWMMVNRRPPLPAPPVPAVTTTTESTLTCTCSSRILNETETTQPKAASDYSPGVREHVQLDALQRRGVGSADYHVVNILQEEWCSKCKRSTKPVKTVTFDDPVHSPGTPETQQQPDVQILIFQTNTQTQETGEGNAPVRCDDHVLSEGESLNSQHTFRSQATSGLSELEADGAVSSSRCDSSADSSLTSEEAKALEDVQTASDAPQVPTRSHQQTVN